MKYFSTFSGIGGFEIGIHNAYNEYARISEKSEQEERSQGVEWTTDKQSTLLYNRNWSTPLCVGYSEIDKYATKVYEKHFKGAKNYGDITKINAEELPDFDCLVGGFPCQAFSIAGKRGGFDDTRGTLFFDLARILRAKQPRLFVFENVKGLLSHDNGKTFRTIITTIDELGYDAQWQVVNSKNHGVPQNRERIIIVGHLRGTTRPEVFPIREDGNPLTTKGGRQTSDAVISRTLTATDAKMHLDGNYINQINNPKHSNERVYAPDGISPTLNTMQSGQRQPFVAQEMQVRRLTPLECERLQAFPDGWTSEGVDGPISDSQRYKMCGNAVTTNVIKAVFERIFSSV